MSTPEDEIYSQPPEPPVLQAIGIVTIRHSEHEDVLRMLLRTFLHQDAQEARKHFAYMGPRVLREKAAEIGRAIFGPGEVLDQLVALLARSEHLSKQRNEWVHALYGVDWLDRPLRREKSGKWVEQPTLSGQGAFVSLTVKLQDSGQWQTSAAGQDRWMPATSRIPRAKFRIGPLGAEDSQRQRAHRSEWSR